MSLKKSTTRRAALFTSSSLVAASLTAFAFAGAVLAPAVAQAHDECVATGATVSDGANGVSDPTLNGATADTFSCTGATTYQTTGITYSSQGNLTVGSTGAMDVGAVGINLTGNTTASVGDNVTFSATGLLTGTSGAVLDVTSTSGNITATTTGVTATTAGMTNGVRLQSTGAGNITFTKNGTTNTSNIVNTAEGAQAAVAAITNGGNIVITTTSTTNSFGTSGGKIQGRLRGILAQTSGAGSVTLNVTGRRGIYADADGVAAVDIIGGTGGVTVNLAAAPVGGRELSTGSNERNPFVDSLALRVASASAVTINNTSGLIVGAVDFSGVTAGGVVFDNVGTGAQNFSGFMLASGGRWIAAGDSVFSGQDDLVRMRGTRTNTTESGTTIDFGGGDDTLEMSGVLVSHGAVISNLEAFSNSGSLYLGADLGNDGNIFRQDSLADDLLSMEGATFTGSGASHLYLDAVLGGVSQVGCATLTGAADCLDLRGGSTAGSTVLTINDASPATLSSGYVPEGITLVDVSGAGTSAAGHFTLDPASTDGYVHPVYGAAFDRPGAFVYLFRYDAENQRHVLISQPKTRDLFDYAVLSGAAQSIWHMTSQTVTGRQTDLRDGAEGGSVWLRTTGEVTRRDVKTVFAGWDDTYVFDNSYNLYAGTIMGGIDVFSGAAGAFDYVLGAQIGYVSSSLDMDDSDSSGRFTGATGGAYGSLWSDWFFLDTAVNVNGLALDYQHPALGSKTTTYVNSIGASAEAGMRTALTENTFAEPMAAVSWVRTSFEEISLSVGEVQPADAESLRTGLGMRLGATLPGESVSASYFVTGRGWYEFEGESQGVVHNPGADLPFADEFTGAFGEAELGVNIFNASNTLSGFATTGVKWKEGYSAVNLALGVRLAW